ncbi:mitochondrial cytochrome b2 [Penicillium macrosclerotiorum]|uniref:mitochondrial cytochrome b2 n=1 Tax=Penicillium macrosclerotiorum TaxID=303699 RepID=UPI002547C6C3|nr:mitochondrial cytochrome b2 [Penicillium macrosclerotiorum]KAJ5668926.1 mitochondrial cytochrome b2 [Penicillium macrosclerotiorum]
MGKVFDATEVAKHNNSKSCWVILYGKIYDVTNFLAEHPGGANVILKLAGKDATEEFDPVHPAGTLEENLKPEAFIGNVDPATVTKKETPVAPEKINDHPPVTALLNMDEIEEVATAKISKKAWGYYYSAADDKITKRLNTEAFRSIVLRPRVFIDCTECSLDVSLLGNPVSMPIYVSPAAQARLGHPTGEAGIAEACRSFGALQIISNSASMTPEQIVENASPDQSFGWQLYVQENRNKSEKMIARINKLRAIKFVVLTLDTPVMGKREDDQRSGDVINEITEADLPETARKDKEKQVFAGLDPTLTWRETLSWLAKHTKLPVILKGIQTHEDAYIATLYRPQVKGIILSNHGGRSLDTSPPAVHTLLEIRKYCPEVFDKVEVWIDGGVKRGTDVVKAICLGAKGVGIGRPPLWGLAAGGVDGVKRTLQILADETKTCMRLLGVQKLDQLGMHHINARTLEEKIYDGPSRLDICRADHKSKL